MKREKHPAHTVGLGTLDHNFLCGATAKYKSCPGPTAAERVERNTRCVDSLALLVLVQVVAAEDSLRMYGRCRSRRSKKQGDRKFEAQTKLQHQINPALFPSGLDPQRLGALVSRPLDHTLSSEPTPRRYHAGTQRQEAPTERYRP